MGEEEQAAARGESPLCDKRRALPWMVPNGAAAGKEKRAEQRSAERRTGRRDREK